MDGAKPGVNIQHLVTSTVGAAETAGFPIADLLQALPAAVYITDVDGRITFYNDAAAELWGHRPVIGDSQWCGSWKLRHPDGRPMPHEECPMAVALREEREIRWGQAIAERPDGSLVPFMAYPTPLRDASGAMIGAVNTLVDLSSQNRADEAGMRLAAIVESSMDAIVSKDINGIITSWNQAAERLFGYTSDEAVGQPVTILIPHDHLDEEASIISRIRIGERVPTYETIRRHKSGALIPVSLTISPVRDISGRIVGASKIARDITGHKESERRIRLLMREVNHRVKNQYSVIISMIRETSKRAKSPEAFERQVRERIMALSNSHDLLVNAEWRGATVFDLITAQIMGFGHEDRISISGPPLVLQPNAVQYLGIAFHELATNSAKYGVLSGHSGKIAVEWNIFPAEDAAATFRLIWREEEGPEVVGIRAGGFGTVVLERVTPQSLNGTGRVEYGANGITWTLKAPLNCVEVSLDAQLAT